MKTRERLGRLDSVLFESSGEQLLGRVFVADGDGPHPTLLLLHGFPGTELNFDIAHAVRRCGWNVFLPHYRGAWGMPGAYSFSNVVEDVFAAVRYLRSAEYADKFDGDPERLVVVGHSLGGFAAMLVGAADTGVAAVGCLAGFNFGAYASEIAMDEDAIAATEQDWSDSVFPLNIASSSVVVREMLEKRAQWDLKNYAHALAGRPVLLIAGANDAAAPPSFHYVPLLEHFQALNFPMLTAELFEADHGFTQTRMELCETITKWLEQVSAVHRESLKH